MTWQERINAALERDPQEFTEEDLQQAGDFITCAVGESLQGRAMRGVVSDTDYLELSRLGMDFWYAVKAHKPGRAQELLEEIQAQASRVVFK